MRGAFVRHELMQLSKRHDALVFKLAHTERGTQREYSLQSELSQVMREQKQLKYLLKNAWIDAVARVNGIDRHLVNLLPRGA